jgi:hypothetical protein
MANMVNAMEIAECPRNKCFVTPSPILVYKAFCSEAKKWGVPRDSPLRVARNTARS